jgi:hypothetical protein
VLPRMHQGLAETSMALEGAPDRRQLHEIRACTDDVQNVHGNGSLILTIFFFVLFTSTALRFRQLTDGKGMQTNEYLHAPLESSWLGSFS